MYAALFVAVLASQSQGDGYEEEAEQQVEDEDEADDYEAAEEYEEDYAPDPRDPRRLPYEDGMEVPPGYVLTSRIRTGWMITGIAVFLGAYAYTALFVSASGGDISGTALIPGIGPIIGASTSSDGFDGLDGLLVVDGVVQLAAIALGLWAVFDERELLIREDLAIAPVIGPSGGGVAFSAKF